MSRCSRLGVEKSVTLSPLGIRRNMSPNHPQPWNGSRRYAVHADLCMHQPVKPPMWHLDLQSHAHACATGFRNGRSTKRGLILLPQVLDL